MDDSVREEILNKLRGKYHTLNAGEKAVARVLAKADKPLTQKAIARSEPFLGAHPQFEGYETDETTLRKVRQIIHDLKVIHGITVVSNTRGYWIPNSRDEAEEYLDTFERQARSSAKSYMVTVAAIRESISGLRERPTTLFEL